MTNGNTITTERQNNKINNSIIHQVFIPFHQLLIQSMPAKKYINSHSSPATMKAAPSENHYKTLLALQAV